MPTGRTIRAWVRCAPPTLLLIRALPASAYYAEGANAGGANAVVCTTLLVYALGVATLCTGTALFRRRKRP